MTIIMDGEVGVLTPDSDMLNGCKSAGNASKIAPNDTNDRKRSCADQEHVLQPPAKLLKTFSPLKDALNLDENQLHKINGPEYQNGIIVKDKKVNGTAVVNGTASPEREHSPIDAALKQGSQDCDIEVPNVFPVDNSLQCDNPVPTKEDTHISTSLSTLTEFHNVPHDSLSSLANGRDIDCSLETKEHVENSNEEADKLVVDSLLDNCNEECDESADIDDALLDDESLVSESETQPLAKGIENNSEQCQMLSKEHSSTCDNEHNTGATPTSDVCNGPNTHQLHTGSNVIIGSNISHSKTIEALPINECQGDSNCSEVSGSSLPAKEAVEADSKIEDCVDNKHVGNVTDGPVSGLSSDTSGFLEDTEKSIALTSSSAEQQSTGHSGQSMDSVLESASNSNENADISNTAAIASENTNSNEIAMESSDDLDKVDKGPTDEKENNPDCVALDTVDNKVTSSVDNLPTPTTDKNDEVECIDLSDDSCSESPEKRPQTNAKAKEDHNAIVVSDLEDSTTEDRNVITVLSSEAQTRASSVCLVSSETDMTADEACPEPIPVSDSENRGEEARPSSPQVPSLNENTELAEASPAKIASPANLISANLETPQEMDTSPESSSSAQENSTLCSDKNLISTADVVSKGAECTNEPNVLDNAGTIPNTDGKEPSSSGQQKLSEQPLCDERVLNQLDAEQKVEQEAEDMSCLSEQEPTSSEQPLGESSKPTEDDSQGSLIPASPSSSQESVGQNIVSEEPNNDERKSEPENIVPPELDENKVSHVSDAENVADGEKLGSVKSESDKEEPMQVDDDNKECKMNEVSTREETEEDTKPAEPTHEEIKPTKPEDPATGVQQMISSFSMWFQQRSNTLPDIRKELTAMQAIQAAYMTEFKIVQEKMTALRVERERKKDQASSQQTEKKMEVTPSTPASPLNSLPQSPASASRAPSRSSVPVSPSTATEQNPLNAPGAKRNGTDNKPPLSNNASPLTRRPTVKQMLNDQRTVSTGSTSSAPPPDGDNVVDLTSDDERPASPLALQQATKSPAKQPVPLTTALNSLAPGPYIIKTGLGGQKFVIANGNKVPVSSPTAAGLTPASSPGRSNNSTVNASPTGSQPSGAAKPATKTTARKRTRPRPSKSEIPKTVETAASTPERPPSPDVVITSESCATPPNKQHPAPLPPQPRQTSTADLKLIPPKPHLKINRVPQGLVLCWNMPLADEHETVVGYQVFAYQQSAALPNSNLWKKVGDVQAMALPMACTLTQCQQGQTYHFAVRPVDKHKRVGVFSDACTINLS